MTSKVEHQIIMLLQRSHEHALIARFTTDPEARSSNQRMARECIEHARLMIEESAQQTPHPEVDYTEALQRALDELASNCRLREFPHSRH